MVKDKSLTSAVSIGTDLDPHFALPIGWELKKWCLLFIELMGEVTAYFDHHGPQAIYRTARH